MTKQRAQKILSSLSDFYGDVKPDLDFINVYQVAVAVVLSAQTTDRQVNGVTKTLFSRYPDFAALSQANLDDIERIVKSTGFYHNKAKNIISLSKEVMTRFNGVLPHTMEELLTLSGIGRKSANVILSAGFNLPGLAVDTHVLRISNRLGFCETENPDVCERALTSVIDMQEWGRAHLLLIRHGRATCKARKPLCAKCPIKQLCLSTDKTV